MPHSSYIIDPDESAPDGFRVIRVMVTDKEFVDLAMRGSLLGSGLASSALRVRAGLAENPWGIRRALAEQRNLTPYRKARAQ